MIRYSKYSVFDENTDAIVNTVNCFGVMGKGLALEFKNRFPDMFNDYKKRCIEKKVKPGIPYIFKEINGLQIINFPTKFHWKNPTKIEWIEKGLRIFVKNYESWNVKSVSFPKLGSNLGGLDFEKDVKPIMEKYLRNISIQVVICLNEDERFDNIVNIFNSNYLEILKESRVKKKVTALITDNIPIRKIGDLKNIKGIGTKTYSKIYSITTQKKNNQIQEELFN